MRIAIALLLCSCGHRTELGPPREVEPICESAVDYVHDVQWSDCDGGAAD